MCTVREIQEAIREHCQSQHDMESTEIDRVMQRLPFVSERAAGNIAPDRRSLFERLRLFSCHEL